MTASELKNRGNKGDGSGQPTTERTRIPVKSSITVERVSRYVTEQIVVDTPLERELREDTMRLPESGMISSSDVGAFLALLARSIHTRRAIEVGTFTGYTALKVAEALAEDGELICCDIDADWTAIGRRYWQQARVAQKIDLRLAPATQTLEELIRGGQVGKFDFAFIDADKAGYESYYEACLRLVRPGGLIVLDNMLWDGKVADPDAQDETTRTLRYLNEKISRDQRVSHCLLTVGDGLMIAQKK